MSVAAATSRPDGGSIGDTAAAVAALDRAFGDPWRADNPLGFAACLAADERGDLLAAGEEALDRYGLGAEFVPVAHGGRLSCPHRTVAVLRAVYRRDPCLGLGYGASSLMAAANVWTAGSPRQRAEVATLLREGGKLACAYHELAHGSDLTGNELSALPAGDRLIVTGRKEVIANIARARAMVLFARTGPGPGQRAHSQLLLHRDRLPATRVRDLPRFTTAGMRGVPLGGVEFTDCPVEPDAVLGEPGGGLATALRSFQLTRVVVPGMTLGILDTALRVAVRYAGRRRLYGAPLATLPYAAGVLAEAYADLLLCDAFCQVAAEALVRAPELAGRYAAAVKYLVPRVLIDAVTSLSALLGASFYQRDGEYGYLQKLLRDVRPSAFGHASAVTCQLALLPHLPRLARRAWSAPAAPIPGLFDAGERGRSDDGGRDDGGRDPGGRDPGGTDAGGTDTGGTALDLTRLTLRDGGTDPALAPLLTAPDLLTGAGPELAALRTSARWFGDRLRELAADCQRLPAHQLGAAAGPDAFALASRYTILLAAGCCLGVWSARRRRDPGADPAWTLLALDRLARRLGGHRPAPATGARERLIEDLHDRYHRDQTFDLARRDIAGGRPTVTKERT